VSITLEGTVSGKSTEATTTKVVDGIVITETLDGTHETGTNNGELGNSLVGGTVIDKITVAIVNVGVVYNGELGTTILLGKKLLGTSVGKIVVIDGLTTMVFDTSTV